jgi:putative glutathione S-transferase
VAGRYHLYVGNACPWCHRVLLTLAVRGIAGAVTITRLLDEPENATRGGWVMPREGDPAFGARDLWWAGCWAQGAGGLGG